MSYRARGGLTKACTACSKAWRVFLRVEASSSISPSESSSEMACAEHFCQIGPNGPKIQKETTHDLLSWRRRASMA